MVLQASPLWNDGSLLTQVPGTPTIVFGPGITELAHFPNEVIELENILNEAKIIATTVVDCVNLVK